MRKKLLIIISVSFILLFSGLVISCGGGAGGQSETDDTGYYGTWVRADGVQLKIDGSSWEVWSDGVKQFGGTYTFTAPGWRILLTVTYPPQHEGEGSEHRCALESDYNRFTLTGGNALFNGIYVKSNGASPVISKFEGYWVKDMFTGLELHFYGNKWNYYDYTSNKCSGTFTCSGSALNFSITAPSSGTSNHNYQLKFSDNTLKIEGGSRTDLNGTYVKKFVMKPLPSQYDYFWEKEDFGSSYQLYMRDSDSIWEYYLEWDSSVDFMNGGSFVDDGSLLSLTPFGGTDVWKYNYTKTGGKVTLVRVDDNWNPLLETGEWIIRK